MDYKSFKTFVSLRYFVT